jgi:N4-(beta-N-acetylglucosaminyl)-L-asparaginase
MRQGNSPQQACEKAVRRISKQKNAKDIQIGFLAISKKGEVGAYSLQPGFNFAQYAQGTNQMKDVGSFYS